MTLTTKEHETLIDWIKGNLTPRKTFNSRKTSYGLKHIFEQSPNGFYIENDIFKAAMLECGFKVQNKAAVNWVFNISQKSPALKS